MNTIFCHICDEELADTVDNLPDKCPICDTRKYEIIQEIKSLEETEETNNQIQTPQIEIITTIAENPITELEITSEPQVVDSQIISDPQIVEPSETNDNKKESHVTQVEAFSNNMPAVVVEEQDPISDIVCYDDESDDGIIFKENISLIDVKENVVFDDDVASDVVFDDTPDVVFDDPALEKEKLPSKPSIPQKTGASSLEVLPDKETGFPKGCYLILYNAEKKAIAYFKIDEVGSIIIGRSSERGSQNDIDLTMAWKYAYKDKAGSNAFQDKMKMVKGISRKHALVRYDKSKKSYVFFHLSDKNYTIVKTQQGEKRERAPKNRNPIYLEPGSLISMGNHKNYIIMRFKEVK
ncbi:FHA domain-containing protein [Candidatus Uabimicrobium sp. HlEnr_7]|uniref:FHA domain-containing protein n=1 Tax=Candidatus Uabimicrobium helgolandensis TaxID=3095367 RepID=UPI003556DFDD